MTRTTRYAPLIVLALAVVWTVGCEDSGVTAPDDSTITVLATPSTITIDPNVSVETPPGSGIFLPQTQGTTTISAKVLDADGDPLSGVSVSFTTEAGNLGSFDEQSGTSTPVQTNSNGIATDTLTVGTADPAEIDVTALSGTISGTVTVTKNLATINAPPVARVVISPLEEQVIGQPVIFDGTTSSDPDGDPITVWSWSIQSSTGGVPVVFEGPGVSALPPQTYDTVRTLSGTLRITDDPAAPRQFQLQQPIVYRHTAPFSYQIVTSSCNANHAPVARIAEASPISLSGAANSTVPTTLTGIGTDQEGGIQLYVWTCGNSTPPVPVADTNGAQVTCSYTVQTTLKEYTPTLLVKDFGTGVAGPDGVYPCTKVSPTVQVTVKVSPTAVAR